MTYSESATKKKEDNNKIKVYNLRFLLILR